jgi:uncharacterized protein (TIGR02996 family)
MNGTLTGLLEACTETPEDSTPYLILADWLDDHGQAARAELIRIQCRLADWIPDWEERQALIARQEMLIAIHQESWLGGLESFACEVDFVRGLTHLRLASAQFCSGDFGDWFATQRETALIQHVAVHTARGVKRLVSRPWIEWIPSLAVAGLRLKDEALTPLLEGPLLHRLVALDLSYNRLNRGTVLDLPKAPVGSNLARLSLRCNGLDPRDLTQLLQADWPHLRELDLGCNHLLTALPGELQARYLALRGAGAQTRLVNSLGMEFVRIPAGSFRMGAAPDERNPQPDEYEAHTVTLTRPFYLGRFTVTQREYVEITGETPSHFRGDWRPVDRVGPENADEFCRLLGNLPAERAAGRTYRLPTEAEWEHACRAGTFTPFYFGNEPTLSRMNFQGRWEAYDPPVPYPGATTPVGLYPPNPFGLYEMHGNVWEPCSDWHSASWYTRSPAVDPVGPEEGEFQVRRGGCFEAIGSYCRAAKRHGAGPQRGGTRHHGFRIVLVPADEAI